MPETITIAGKQFPKPAIYVVGAGVAGIVGYAWWTKGTEEEPVETITDIPIDDMGDERIPTTGVPTPSQFGTPPPTNAEWGTKATDRLASLGIDPIAASSAIGKFLQRKPLSATEANLVRQAISQTGNPPEGGPWTIIESSIPPAQDNRAQIDVQRRNITKWKADLAAYVKIAQAYNRNRLGALRNRRTAEAAMWHRRQVEAEALASQRRLSIKTAEELIRRLGGTP